jgi:hypothetical protein
MVAVTGVARAPATKAAERAQAAAPRKISSPVSLTR